MSTKTIDQLQQELKHAQENVAFWSDMEDEAEKALNEAQRIKPEDIVLGARFVKKADRRNVKTVIQYDGDTHRGQFALMGIDYREFHIGGEGFSNTIPHRLPAVEVANWLIRSGFEKAPQ